MELVKKQGGLGRIRTNASENAKLDALFEVIGIESSNSAKLYQMNHGPARLYQMNPDPKDVRQFEKIMEDLFPFFDIKKPHKDDKMPSYSALGFKQSPIVAFGSSENQNVSITGFNHNQPQNYNSRVKLEILKTPSLDGDWAMSVMLFSLDSYNYRPGPVDDLVNTIGAMYSPTLIGLEEVLIDRESYYGSSYFDSNGKPLIQYGIADVPRVNEVLDLYARAQTVLRQGEIGLSDLEILKSDGEKHSNLFLRKESANMYNQLIESLAKLL
jgi:hypothetical protein